MWKGYKEGREELVEVRTKINGFNPEPIQDRTSGVGVLVQTPGSLLGDSQHEFDTWITHAEIAMSTLSNTLNEISFCRLLNRANG
ncbi:hypothetical protein V1477_011255 [Vespula maculifrons]|uniref:Uncharacterized protein n=1 Tax=Vespula maculifrons TaxID=7453 RepID=A0ABD2C498_VESMC